MGEVNKVCTVLAVVVTALVLAVGAMYAVMAMVGPLGPVVGTHTSTQLPVLGGNDIPQWLHCQEDDAIGFGPDGRITCIDGPVR